MSWLPVYLTNIKTIAIDELLTINSLPWVLGSSSMLLGGIFARNLSKRRSTSQSINYMKVIEFCLACSSISIFFRFYQKACNTAACANFVCYDAVF